MFVRAVVMAMLLALTGAAAAACMPAINAVPDLIGCQEDEACWDCATMGNRICGPVEP